jgi:hypothetical protein
LLCTTKRVSGETRGALRGFPESRPHFSGNLRNPDSRRCIRAVKSSWRGGGGSPRSFARVVVEPAEFAQDYPRVPNPVIGSGFSPDTQVIGKCPDFYPGFSPDTQVIGKCPDFYRLLPGSAQGNLQGSVQVGGGLEPRRSRAAPNPVAALGLSQRAPIRLLYSSIFRLVRPRSAS